MGNSNYKALFCIEETNMGLVSFSINEIPLKYCALGGHNLGKMKANLNTFQQTILREVESMKERLKELCV